MKGGNNGNFTIHLEEFHPALEKFVDKEYVTVLGSEVSSEGIVKLERGLAKKQQPFGTFIVQYNFEGAGDTFAGVRSD